MTIKDYLKNGAHYDHIWGQIMSGSKNIAMIRGYSSILDAFEGDVGKTEIFQQELGEFVAEAIKEKLERL